MAAGLMGDWARLLSARRRPAGAMGLAASTLVAACNAPANPNALLTDPDALPKCGLDVVVTVTPQPAPTFSWTPRCGVQGLLVFDSTLTFHQWNISSSAGRADIAGPVTYGVRPEGTRQNTRPAELVAQARYHLWLWVATGDGSGETVAQVEFVRAP